ncbi:acyl-CoA dehydrogenase family protein [Streptomyces sp. NPDC127106]|uniref:acyl-CoA dehydrogenase family protein n=1 Tax=Streptomyces sp. NPDC127106 TaxID=3345360 RepID=UPI00363590D9
MNGGPRPLVSRYTREHAPLLDSFRTFVTRELVPLAAETCGDDPERIPQDIRSQVRRRSARLGFYAGDYPQEAGGQGMPFAAKVLLYEYAEESGCALAPAALCGPEGPSALLLAATPEQRERYLRPLVEGTAVRCLAMTEPDSGSDAFDLATRAVRDGDGWRLTGRKTFVSNAAKADFTLVYARTERPDGSWAPAVFVLERGTPGLTVGQRYAGLEGEPVHEVLLDGVAAGEDALLGGRAALDKGTRIGQEALARGRLLVAACANGIAARALALGLGFARERMSLGRRIAQHQHVQEHLVASRVALESARLLTYAAAQELDEGRDAMEAAALAKLAAADAACTVVDRMFQVHGGTAWVKEHPLEYLYRHVRVLRIVEGTSEIQKVIIANAMGLG